MVVRVGIEFQTSQAAAAAKRLQADMAKLHGEIKKINPAAKNSLRSIEQFAGKGSIRIEELNSKTRQLNNSFGGLGSVLRRVSIGFAAVNAAQAGIARDESERRLRLLTQAFGETEQAQEAARRAADKFNLSQTEANVQLSRLIARLRPMGMSMETIETAFAGFNTATILAGATASESAGAFLQLSQALGSGVLRGQELNSILEQAPLIAQAIATEMGTTVGALKKFGEEGQISSQVVIAALQRVEREGAAQLEEALKGPAAAIKDFQNASEDVKVALTQDIIPEMADSFRELADLIRSLGPLIRGIGGSVGGGLGAINDLISINTKDKAGSAREILGRGRIAPGERGLPELFEPIGGAAFVNKMRQQAASVAKVTGKEFNTVFVERLQQGLRTVDVKAANLPANFMEMVDRAPGAFKPSTEQDKTKEQKDASQKLVDLNRELFGSTTQLSELEKILLEFQIEKQEISERGLTANNEKIALLKAEAGFEADLLDFRQDQLDLQKKAADIAERERKKREAEEKRRREADPGFQMKQKLEELLNVQNQVAAGATVIGNSFAGAFKSVITGSKSAEDALRDMLAATAEHFLNMAMEIIAQQLTMILYGTIMKALGVTMPGGGGGGFGSGASAPLTSNLDFSSAFTMAEGGYVSGPTNALVGEGGEPEYVIPESKMRESMARYSRGARGGSVIPETGSGGTSEDGGGTAVAEPIDVRYTVERINSVDYVTADQFQRGMQQAAAQGANAGEKRALFTLRQNTAQRKRIGL